MISVGALLACRYKVVRALGQGGMGQVYLVQDEKLGRQVAMKVLLGPDSKDSSDKRRLIHEIEACLSIRHPNVINLLDCGLDEEIGPYYTMDYVSGESLAQRLDKCERLSPRETKKLLKDIANGLYAIHSEGLVHRDLTTGNILLSHEGAIISDFGLVLDEMSTQLTATGMVLGTPAYVAPEAMTGNVATEQSDIYQVAVIGFKAITGSFPFAGENFDELFKAILNGKSPKASTFVPGLSSAWDDFFTTCLAHAPSQRPASAKALLALIDKLPEVQAGAKAKQSKENEASRPPYALMTLVATTILFLFLFISRYPHYTEPRHEKVTPVKLLSAIPKGRHLHLSFANTLQKPLIASIIKDGQGKRLDFQRVDEGQGTKVIVASVDDVLTSEDLLLRSGNQTISLRKLLIATAKELINRMENHCPTKTVFKDGYNFGPRMGTFIAVAKSATSQEREAAVLKGNRARAKAIRQKLKNEVARDFVESYRHAANLSPLVQSFQSVEPAIKQRLYEALDVGRRLELLAAIEFAKFSFCQRSAFDLRETTVKPRPNFLGERIIFQNEPWVVMGHPGFTVEHSPLLKLPIDFEWLSPASYGWFELVFDVNTFKRITFSISLNGQRAGRLLCNPWQLKDGHEGKVDSKQFLLLPNYLLKQGQNKMLIRAEVLFGTNINSRLLLSRVRLRWGK